MLFTAGKRAASPIAVNMQRDLTGLTIIGLQNVIEKGGIPQPVSGAVPAIALQKLQMIRHRNTSQTRTDAAEGAGRHIPFVSCRSSWR